MRRNRDGISHLTAELYSCLDETCDDACEAVELAQHTCENSLDPIEEAPETLAETGLYVLGATGEYELAPYLRSYAPGNAGTELPNTSARSAQSWISSLPPE